MNKLIVYGDQLIASSGPHNGYNVEPGNHWWELIANDLGREAVNLSSPKKCTGISPTICLLVFCRQWQDLCHLTEKK